MFGIRLVCPVDEFNASRHVGDDSLTDPPTRPPRKPAANRLACGWSLPTSSTSDSGRSSLRPGLRRHRRRPEHRRGSRLTTSTKQTSKARDVFSELACLVEALKAPALREQPWRLAERARGEGLEPRGISGGVPAAGGRRPRLPRRRRPHPRSRFPSRKSLEDFDFDHQRFVKREVIADLGTLGFVVGKGNVIFLGPPAPVSPTSPPARASGPARQATGLRSRQPLSGSPASPTPTRSAVWATNLHGSDGSR